MSSSQLNQQVNLGIEALKATPPATTAALTFFGYPIADWVQLVMLFYAIGLVVQMLARFSRWIRIYRK